MTDLPYGGVNVPFPVLRPPMQNQTAAPIRVVNPKALAASAAAAATGAWTVVPKSASETRSLTTVLANDGHLLFVMAANTKYAIRASILFDTGTAADFKWALTGPAAPTLARIARRWIVGNGAAYAGISVDTGYTPAQGLDGTTGAGLVEFYATIQNGVNAGAFAFQWAQNTSDAGLTVVLAGSTLEYMVI